MLSRSKRSSGTRVSPNSVQKPSKHGRAQGTSGAALGLTASSVTLRVREARKQRSCGHLKALDDADRKDAVRCSSNCFDPQAKHDNAHQSSPTLPTKRILIELSPATPTSAHGSSVQEKAGILLLASRQAHGRTFMAMCSKSEARGLYLSSNNSKMALSPPSLHSFPQAILARQLGFFS